MRKNLLCLIALLIVSIIGKSQEKPTEEFKPSGTGIGVVFFDYKYDLTKDAVQKSAYEISRAYLGYKYDFSKAVSGKVIFDMAYDATLKNYSVFLKNAQLDWAVLPMLKLSMGMIGLKHFDTQEKFMNNRYVMKTMIDNYGFGVAADLGLNVEIPVNDMFTFNLFAVNGEGFKSLQDKDGLHRFGGNVIAKPIDGLLLKLHYEMNEGKDHTAPTDTANISCLSAFVGYEVKDKFRLSIEYNKLNNGKDYKTYSDSYTLDGLSVFGAYDIDPKFEIFARYDLLESNIVGNAANEWNYNKDGSLVMAGVQYKIAKGVNISANYRTWMYKNTNINSTNGLYLNLGFVF